MFSRGTREVSLYNSFVTYSSEIVHLYQIYVINDKFYYFLIFALTDLLALAKL